MSNVIAISAPRDQCFDDELVSGLSNFGILYGVKLFGSEMF